MCCVIVELNVDGFWFMLLWMDSYCYCGLGMDEVVEGDFF